jgi:diguanylate cyclase (GGDEF)-like protein
MKTQITLSHWLEREHHALEGAWSETLSTELKRLLDLPARAAVFRRAYELLLILADLVEHPVAGAGTSDERFKTVLRELKRLQSEEQLSSAEVILLLFTVRHALKLILLPRPESAGLLTGIDSSDADQLGSLLTRLGLVFLETSSRTVDDLELPADSNVEYALRYERARQMAITDSLTGLHNFGYFRDRLTEECRRAERYQRLLSLIIFDLDHFKRYNDTHGHPAGNDVLKGVANILRHEARETDLVARYGGEELVIVLPETNRKTAWDVAERIRQRVSERSFETPYAATPEHVTLSAGVATFPVDATHEEELISRADASLYAAKSSGRNRVVAYEPPHKVSIVYYPEPGVQRVALVGSFNNWDKDADPMLRRPDGVFEFTISLNPGDYCYKFVLNGSVWISDPKNHHTQPDNMGGVNSLLQVTAADLPPELRSEQA